MLKQKKKKSAREREQNIRETLALENRHIGKNYHKSRYVLLVQPMEYIDLLFPHYAVPFTSTDETHRPSREM